MTESEEATESRSHRQRPAEDDSWLEGAWLLRCHVVPALAERCTVATMSGAAGMVAAWDARVAAMALALACPSVLANPIVSTALTAPPAPPSPVIALIDAVVYAAGRSCGAPATADALPKTERQARAVVRGFEQGPRCAALASARAVWLAARADGVCKRLERQPEEYSSVALGFLPRVDAVPVSPSLSLATMLWEAMLAFRCVPRISGAQGWWRGPCGQGSLVLRFYGYVPCDVVGDRRAAMQRLDWAAGASAFGAILVTMPQIVYSYTDGLLHAALTGSAPERALAGLGELFGSGSNTSPYMQSRVPVWALMEPPDPIVGAVGTAAWQALAGTLRWPPHPSSALADIALQSPPWTVRPLTRSTDVTLRSATARFRGKAPPSGQ